MNRCSDYAILGCTLLHGLMGRIWVWSSVKPITLHEQCCTFRRVMWYLQIFTTYGIFFCI